MKFALFANGENYLWHYTSYDYVVLENYKPEEKKELKPKLKFEEGDFVYLCDALSGCDGANSRVGIVTDREASNGLSKPCGLDTTNVIFESGRIWCVNTDGIKLL